MPHCSAPPLTRTVGVAVLFVATIAATPAHADWTLGVFIGGTLTQSSSLHLVQESSRTDVVLTPVRYRSESFALPIYYGYRGGVFPRSGWFGIEGEFIHMKVIADTSRMASVNGQLNGRQVSTQLPVDDVIQYFAISHGVNLLLANVVARYRENAAQPAASRWILSGRFGAGGSIPHPESTIAAVSREQYEWGAFSMQVAGAAEVRLFKRIYATGEYKFTRTTQEVSVVGGTARTSLRTHHLVVGISGYFGADR